MNISHKLLLPILLGSLFSLTGCQSAPKTPAANAAINPQQTVILPKKPEPQKILYKNMTDFGEMMGCKSAFQQQGTPDSDFINAPKLKGTKQDYIDGWKKGFNKCLMGLGPVQLPVQK